MKTKPEPKTRKFTPMTLEEFSAIGTERFGPDRMKWKFVCPACGHVQSAQDYKDAGAPESAVAFSCVGRWAGAKRDAFEDPSKPSKPGPCNCAGGGLFRIAPILIKTEKSEGYYFEFAEAGS